MNLSSPAQLWIGQHNSLIDEIQLFLQKKFCTHGGCQTCISCMHIREQQYHKSLWFYPEKNGYTVEQFEHLFTTISFYLDNNEEFFFIIQKADFLTHICANKLLKVMEEPPHGYHFILLTDRPEQILPTIRSRCMVYKSNNALSIPYEHPFYQLFTTKSYSAEATKDRLIESAKIIDSTPIGEKETVELVDLIFHYWLTCYKNNPINEREKIITIITYALKKTPMPGSSLLFWRNLYVQIHPFMSKASA